MLQPTYTNQKQERKHKSKTIAYLSIRRSERERGNLSFPYSAAGIVRYIENNPIENTINTPKAAANSHLDNGNFPSLYLLPVGESSTPGDKPKFISSSLASNRPVSTTKLLGTAIDNNNDAGDDDERDTLFFIHLNLYNQVSIKTHPKNQSNKPPKQNLELFVTGIKLHKENPKKTKTNKNSNSN